MLIFVYLLFALVTVFALYYLFRPGALTQTIVSKIARFAGAALLAVLTLYFMSTGKGAHALYVAALVPAVLLNWRNLFHAIKSAKGPTPGKVSEVESMYLRMTLDHDSGSTQGVVIFGAFSGKRLDELDQESLLKLLTECRLNDEDSARLLEAWLDRTQNFDWRNASGHEKGDTNETHSTSSGAMPPEEALRILGLQAGATKHEINEAYKRLISKIHPDQGGTDYLAAKINLARETLQTL
ncbi:MAG: molecular chaperone DnaJ [Rhodospirillales bacterium]|nr:molecular chaperone DnaJ [Rhodospirillales bacterium]